jgi:hypothetical protein
MLPSLAELQRELASRILGGDGPSLESWVRVPEGVDASARLAVYVDGYLARVTDSLRESYPALLLVLGEASFASLVARYVAELDGTPRNLNYVGRDLPHFLAADSLSNDLPFLCDLARLEWAALCCFHSELVDSFDVSACAGWGMDEWAKARIDFQPGLAVVRSAWPIRELRDSRDKERSEIDIDLVDRPDQVLVYRRGLEVITESIDELEAMAIESLGAGASLGEAIADLAATDADPAQLLELFGRWTSAGLVTGCR